MENDVAAVLDPYRTQELLPSGLTNGQTLRRYRGERTDADCVNEVCELVASGITCKAARRHVGVPTTTWKAWRRDNVANVKEKYAIARECQLEEFGDDTIEIFEEVKQQREDALKRWREELKVWDASDKSTREPEYEGPTDFDLRIAEMRARRRELTLEKKHPDYANKRGGNTLVVNVNKNIYQEVRDAGSPEEAMKQYAAILDLRPNDD